MSAKKSILRLLVPQDQVVGYTLDGDLLHLAKMSLRGKKVDLEELTSTSVKPLDIDKKSDSISACTLASNKTLARNFSIALTKPKDVDASFAFEAESHLPYPVDQCVFDKVKLGVANGSTELELFAAQKSDVEALLQNLYEFNLDPEIICPKQLALCHFVKSFLPGEAVTVVIDIDREETSCVLVKDGLPASARAHPSGLNVLEPVCLYGDDGEIEINEDGLPQLHQYLREVARILLSFQTGQEFDNQSLPILFTGPVAENPILVQLIADFLNRSRLPPQKRSGDFSWEKICSFAAPIGAGLSSIYLADGASVNFRKDEFAYGGKWRRWKKELTLYFAAALALSSALYMLGEATLSEQRQNLAAKYATLLVSMEKPVNEQEILSYNADQFEEKLYDQNTALKLNREEMALHPDVPRVSDVLAWLSSHPKVVVAGEEDRAIKLESLNYVMVKRPEKGKLKDQYQVRIDLEFSSPSATMARELHDALLAPNQFVDPKNELKWSVHRGRYRATFFLKDRTKYPHLAVEGASHAGN